MPPVLTGAIVAAIGLVLAPIAIASASGTGPGNPDGDQLSRWIAILTVTSVGAIAVYAPGMTRRLPILLGGAIAYLAYLVLANGFGLGKPVDFAGAAAAAWFGLPAHHAGVFRTGDCPDRPGRRHSGGGKSRAYQGDRRDDRP